jgi:tetratricopeptide (TPR) repeat protein
VNEESVKVLVEEYQDWSDEELIRSHSENDRDQYGEVAFEAMKRVAAERNLTLPSQQAHIPRPKEKGEPSRWGPRLVAFVICALAYSFLKQGCGKEQSGSDIAITEELLRSILDEFPLPIRGDELTTITKVWAEPGLVANFQFEIDATAPSWPAFAAEFQTPDELLIMLYDSGISRLKEDDKSIMALKGVSTRYLYKIRGEFELGELLVLPQDLLGENDGKIPYEDRIKVHPEAKSRWSSFVFSHPDSVEMRRKDAEQGDAVAQALLGYMYETGEGVPKDDKESFKWYHKAAEQGLAKAEYKLGEKYFMKKDYKEAVKWYRKAAEQGDASAQYFLGAAYVLDGRGVKIDNITAYAWFNIAAINGNAAAKEAKEKIPKTMTPEQINKAQELSKEMVKKNPKLINNK